MFNSACRKDEMMKSGTGYRNTRTAMSLEGEDLTLALEKRPSLKIKK